MNIWVYTLIKELEEKDKVDPEDTSRALNYTMLTVVKGFLVPKLNGTGEYKVSNYEDIIKILKQLNEVDWLTVSELVKIVINPYQFKFALRDIVCPKCKNRSEIKIDDMGELLFPLAQSLTSVQVELKSV